MPSSEHFSLNPFSLNAFSRATRAKWAAAIPVLIRLSVNDASRTEGYVTKGFRLKVGVQRSGDFSLHPLPGSFSLNPFSLNTFSIKQCRLT